MVRSAEIGLLLAGDEPWPSLLEWAGRCRSRGWDRVWLSDRGASVAKAAGLGCRIPSMRIGLLVDPGRRLPTVLAKQLTSLDVIIDGRLDLAVEDGPEHLGRFEETAAVLVGLSAGEPLTHDGSLVHADGARCLPPSPQRPAYPVWRLVGQGPGSPPAPGWGPGGSSSRDGAGPVPPPGWAEIGGWLAAERA